MIYIVKIYFFNFFKNFSKVIFIFTDKCVIRGQIKKLLKIKNKKNIKVIQNISDKGNIGSSKQENPSVKALGWY